MRTDEELYKILTSYFFYSRKDQKNLPHFLSLITFVSAHSLCLPSGVHTVTQTALICNAVGSR